MSNGKQQGSTDILSVEVLEIAGHYARLIGEIPPMFTCAVRALRGSASEDPTAHNSSDTSSFHVTRLLNSKAIKASLQFAAMAIHGDKVPKNKELTNKELLKIFGASELSALLALLYLYKKAKKITEEKEWELLSAQLKIDMEIGTYLGLAIPRIGAGNGLILGAIRYIGLALLSKKDLKGFKNYRRGLKTRDLPWDLKEELQLWNCTHLHIASKLLQGLGFGLSASTGLCLGLSLTGDIELGDDAYRWKIAGLWIESLKTTGKEPNCPHKADFYPKQAEMDKLLAEVCRINADGSSFNWIDKTREDLEQFLGKAGSAKNNPNAVKNENNEAEEDGGDVEQILQDLG